jgi:hypothetical protein
LFTDGGLLPMDTGLIASGLAFIVHLLWRLHTQPLYYFDQI